MSRSFSLELLLTIKRLKTPTRMLDRDLLDCFLLECLYRNSSETGSFFASVVDRSHKLHQLASSEKYVTLRQGTDCRLNIRAIESTSLHLYHDLWTTIYKPVRNAVPVTTEKSWMTEKEKRRRDSPHVE
ncbi:uncharacterized protein LOC122566951 [Bombus pyrosoma]|uniref:uncharacterized protein LOC122566951 n=1 Tax=Bombus pyrosoma TaxID=396416 RepID=UPI001CB9C6C8|nr:uncharacterized protein LOC122566951 [Bombus pyrosoma]